MPSVALARLIAAGLAALAVAGAAPGQASGPPLALLGQAPGRLWWSVNRSCELGVMRLETLALRRPSGEHCRVWPSPSGRLAVATLGDPAFLLVDRRLSVLRPGGPSLPDVQHPVGYLNAPVAWSPDEQTLAICLRTAGGLAVARVRLSPRHLSLVAGRCDPSWLADGRLVTDDGPHVLVAGRAVADARRLLGRPDAVVTATATGGGRIVAALAAGQRTGVVAGPGQLVVLRSGGRVVERVPLPTGATAAEVGVAPDGSAAWWYDAATRVARVLVLDDAARPLASAAPPSARWYAWSPDGRFIAAATGRGIVVAEGRRSALLPGVVVHDLAWSR